MVQSVSRRAALALAGCAAAVGLAGCSDGEPLSGSVARAGLAQIEDREGDSDSASTSELAQAALSSMTLEQKVAQLFVVTPEQLTDVGCVVEAGEATRAALEAYPVGGLCYFGANITGDQQLRDMLARTREMCLEVGAGVQPFLTVDEEGGSLVARVANSGCFEVEQVGDMAEIGATGDPARAARVGSVIGSYLHEIGFNVDFAPVADVLTNPDNPVIGPRSFGSDPELVSDMVAAEVTAMLETGVLPCIKHFPGHGDTMGDSHTGAVYSDHTREEIEQREFLPFQAGMAAGCPLVMIGHIETPNFAADGLPASLSSIMMTDVLRGQLGFEGVIVSDSFVMGAITQQYDSATVAVKYLQAGGDIILIPEDFKAAYAGVLAAVQDGVLDEARIDASVLRILEVKASTNLLS